MNRFLADQYQGKFILRFDDTNPLKEEVSRCQQLISGLLTDIQGEFETTIQEDLKMIDIAYDTIVHTSDHFDKIITFTEQLIKQGDMYMDNTDGETVGGSLLVYAE